MAVKARQSSAMHVPYLLSNSQGAIRVGGDPFLLPVLALVNIRIRSDDIVLEFELAYSFSL